MSEQTGLDNTTYDILSVLGREADFYTIQLISILTMPKSQIIMN
jgi:hypothetical protein